MITVTELKIAVEDVFTTEEFDDVRFARLVARAATYYTRWNPIEVTATLTVEADRGTYTLPGDYIGMKDMWYYPTSIPYETYSEDASLELLPSYEITDYANKMIEHIRKAQKVDEARGHWHISGTELQLIPVPAIDMDIVYTYYCAHVFVLGSCSSIPSADFQILVDLVTAEILERYANEYAIEPDYNEGLQKYVKHFIPENVHLRVLQLRQPIARKYGRAICVTS